MFEHHLTIQTPQALRLEGVDYEEVFNKSNKVGQVNYQFETVSIILIQSVAFDFLYHPASLTTQMDTD